MSDVTLVAETGRDTGTRSARRLRAQNKIPGVVYGMGGEATPISVDWPEFRQAMTTEAGANALVTLKYGDKSDVTIVKELQRHPVRRDVLHVDFVVIDLKEKVEVEVPITLVGEARDVAMGGGMVEQRETEILLTVLPTAIPNEIELDITELQIDQIITVDDLTLPDGCEAVTPGDTPIVSASVARVSEVVEEEAAAAEDAAAESAAEPESASEDS